MNLLDPKGLLDRMLLYCVGFMGCVIALKVAIFFLLQIWYWLLLLAAVGVGGWFLIRWLRDRFGRW